MRIFALLLVVMFLGFAVVQYNDPDPYIWIPIYLFPAIVSALIFTGRQVNPLVMLLAAGAFLVGAYFQWPAHWDGVALKNGMKTIDIEEGREALGLVICAVALLVYSWYETQLKARAA